MCVACRQGNSNISNSCAATLFPYIKQILPKNPLFDYALLETHLRGVRKRPEVLSMPNSLGEWSKSSLRASISCLPTAARVRLGHEEPRVRASRPRSLNAWMTLRTVWEVQPKERAICGGCSLLELTRVFGSGAGRRHRRSAIRLPMLWLVL